MPNTLQTSFDIPKGGYVAFDALSLRQLIINRLNQTGVYTDQNFVGSNLASIIDIVAYSFNTLIYYLNRTSSESMFSEAQLYENMNRIVKLIDYNPIGFQTSTLTFECSAQNLLQGLYTIPRYSFVISKNNNITYSFNEDITFAKTTDNATENLEQLSQQKLLFQGRYEEYPNFTATGEPNETIILDTANVTVDHFNIDVYIKSRITDTWTQFTKSSNLYLETPTAQKYEIRLNGNNRYEIKFGNNINGQKLEPGDTIAVYYLVSDGENGEIGPFVFDGTTIPNKLNTVQLNEILADITNKQYRFLTTSELAGIKVVNRTSSTFSQEAESVDDIRQSAPANYKSQYRLVTTSDYVSFIKSNFANIVADVNVINNQEYVTEYLKYYYDIGLKMPEQTERALINQVQFSSSCNFNNVYVIVVPKTSTFDALDYLLPTQKIAISTSVESSKITTTETTFIDPVYKAVTFGLPSPEQTELTNLDIFQGQLLVTKKDSSRRDNQAIINDIVQIFFEYFDRSNIRLGQILDVAFLNQQLLNIEGVESINTFRADNPDVLTQGISFLVWNPLYPNNDNRYVQNNISSKIFEYFYFYNLENIQNQITVRTKNNIFTGLEV